MGKRNVRRNRSGTRGQLSEPACAAPAGSEAGLNGDGVEPYTLTLSVWDGDAALDFPVLVANGDLGVLKEHLVRLGTMITTAAMSHIRRDVGLADQEAAGMGQAKRSLAEPVGVKGGAR